VTVLFATVGSGALFLLGAAACGAFAVACAVAGAFIGWGIGAFVGGKVANAIDSLLEHVPGWK
jgi:hypothetical protein